MVQKYGADKVAQIITFGTMAARAAIRDVGRALGMPYGDVDRVAKMVPTELHVTIEKALQDAQELREVYEQKPEVKKLIDLAEALEGMPRHASTHAAAVVITRDPLTHYLPLYKATDGPVTTQFAKDTVEELGLLKMDLLGLRTLTVISDAVRIIAGSTGQKIDIDQIPIDNKATYEMLSRGETAGVFQLESSGMRSILRDLKPEVFEDIVALVALYRPGPLGSGMVDDFIKNKHGIKKTKYLHPKLEPILKDTYGVILYQEQVMRIASDLAGFSLGEADILRRAMGKKKPEIIAGLRSQFVEGALKNGVDGGIAGQIFDLMEYFAGYGFNKSHSAAYAMVSYQTAYLKANFGLEYMAALLTSIKENTDKVAAYIEECRRLGIEVLPPDVNESRESFTVAGSKIRFGLAAVKNIGLSAVESIIAAREKDGPYGSFADFCRRLDTKVVNKRVIESLIKCGAFDSLGHRRAQLMASVDTGLGLAQQSQRDRENGQLSLLDLFGGGSSEPAGINLPDLAEYPEGELLALEKETLGLYISGHPLAQYRNVLNNLTTVTASDLSEAPEGSEAVLGGLITSIKKINTRKGDTMAFLTVEDLTGVVEVVVFPRIYQQNRLNLRVDEAVMIKGKISENSEEVKIICDEISAIENLLGGELHLKLDSLDSPMLDQVQLILSSFQGDAPVFLHFDKEKKVIKAGREYWVDLSGAVAGRLIELLGQARVKIKRDSNILASGNGHNAAVNSKPAANKEPDKAEAAIVDEINSARSGRKYGKFFSILEL